MKKTLSVILAALLTCTIITACGDKEKEIDPVEGTGTAGTPEKAEAYMPIVDEFANIYLALDEVGTAYINAIECVDGFINGEVTADEALETVRSVKADLEERSLGTADYTVSEELKECMEKNDMDYADLSAVAAEIPTQLNQYILGLESVEEYINCVVEEVPFADEDIRFWIKLDLNEYEIFKEYYFCMVNYPFAEWTGERLDAVMENIFLKAETLYDTDFKWLATKPAVEEYVNVVLDGLEALYEPSADHLAKKREYLAELEVETGITADDAENALLNVE